MLKTILTILKVLILHHEEVAEIIKDIILELGGKSSAQQDLDDFKADTIIDPKTGEVV